MINSLRCTMANVVNGIDPMPRRAADADEVCVASNVQNMM